MGSPQACSGDMYDGVPQHSAVAVRSTVEPLAMLKSMIFASPEGRIMMFAGLMSPMHDAVSVRVVQRVGQPRDEQQRIAPVHRRSTGQDVGQRPALEVLEGHERRACFGIPAHVVHDDDVGMRQARGQACLVEESLFHEPLLFLACGEGQLDDLERHLAVEHEIHRPVDDTHRPASQLGLDGVSAERRAGRPVLVQRRDAEGKDRQRGCHGGLGRPVAAMLLPPP